jgi:glutathione S-transferase
MYTSLIAADASGVEVTVIVPSEEMKADKKFADKKAHGKFPMLETVNGKVLYESVAIANFIIKKGKNRSLLGKSAF